MVKLLICGGGGGAHVLAGIASSLPGVEETRVFTLFQDEAERWTNILKDNDFVINIHEKDSEHTNPISYLKSKPTLVTKDASVAAPGCELIVITVPAFAHAGYLKALKPYVKYGTLVVGCPGNAGFEFEVRSLWGDLGKQCTIMSLESLPWVCRITKFGHGADVFAIKDNLEGALHMGDTMPAGDPKAMMQSVLGEFPKLTISGHLLAVTLMGVNGYIHPAIMYGRWQGSEDSALDESPLFYQGLDHFSADLMGDMSDEVVKVAKALMKLRPKVNLTSVQTIHEYYMRVFGKEFIKDTTDLFSTITTHKAYIGLVHPCIKGKDGKFRPNFASRYMTEDIPYGLLVMKGIAEVAGVETPKIDMVLNWSQKQMGKEYLIGGKLRGKDIKECRAPQSYGITDLDDMLGLK